MGIGAPPTQNGCSKSKTLPFGAETMSTEPGEWFVALIGRVPPEQQADGRTETLENAIALAASIG